MSTPKHLINLSIQDTLRLIEKMINEGHETVAVNLCKAFIPQAYERIDELEARLTDRDTNV